MEEINWEQIFTKLKINTTELIEDLIMILIVVAILAIIYKIITALINRIISRHERKINDPRAKSLITILTLLKSFSRYTIYFIGFAIIINQLGFGSVLSNLVTAAGVGALVVSLGAQNTIGDMVAGGFILFEKQYAVGDYVKINDYVGTVSALAMRCTYLTTWKGEKIIIPNGQIKTVINYSGDFNMAVVDVPTPYEADSEKVLEIIKDVANNYYEQHQDICYDKPNVVAINDFGDSAVVMTIMQKAIGTNHFAIQRDLKMAVKKRFDEEGISIPYSQVVIHNSDL